jgi:hypothetical protein
LIANPASFCLGAKFSTANNFFPVIIPQAENPYCRMFLFLENATVAAGGERIVSGLPCACAG